MYKFFLFSILFPSLLKADVVGNMTTEEILAAANFVGVVSIMKGEFIPNYGYAFEAKVETSLKGNSANTIIIQAPTLHGKTPNHVGEMYLVYLHQSSSENTELMIQPASVVKISRFPLKDKELMQAVLKKGVLDLKEGSLFDYDGFIWVATCREISDNRACSTAMSSASMAFNQSKQ